MKIIIEAGKAASMMKEKCNKMIESSIEALIESTLPTIYGRFKVKAYGSGIDQFPHLTLYTEKIANQEVVDVRIHSECMTGDVFGSIKCDCGEQLEYSMKWVQKNGGVIIYLRQEGRGIGLVNKLKAYNLQENGMNTLEANIELGFHSDDREYHQAVVMLEDLGIEKIRLLTNNPEKIRAFENSHIQVVDRLSIEILPRPENMGYLKTKKKEMGHLLSNS